MNWYFEQRADLLHPSSMLVYPDLMMSQGDNLAHTWRVQVYSGGQPMDLTGYAVTGYFDRSDGKTVAVIGEAVGHVASVLMPQSVYASAGPLTGLLRAVKDGQVITLAAGRWNVQKGPGDEIIDPEHVVPSLEELLAKIDEMERQTNAANEAAGSANSAASAANTAADTATAAASNANTKAAAVLEAANKASAAAEEANASGTAADEAANKANTAAENANAKADAAQTAADNANAAKDGAHAAASRADQAVTAANTAADSATTVAQQVGEKAEAADSAAKQANAAASSANTAAANADTAAGKANTAADNADAKSAAANTAAGKANTAATNAENAAAAANEAAQKALDAAESGGNAVQDVRINGASIVDGGVANVPIAGNGAKGVVDVREFFGNKVDDYGRIQIAASDEKEIEGRSSEYKPITPKNLDYAVKAAMCDGKGAAWTEAEKAVARERIGVSSAASGVYNSMSQIASIVRGNTVEQNALIFPIGDQIVMPWKDMDDPAHNTDETAYQVEWDIVHHGMVSFQDGSEVPGMFLMMHKCSAYNVKFSHQQAFYQAAEALPAGTYHVGFGVKYLDPFTAGTSGQFTLASDVPAGGRLRFSDSNVQVFTSAEAADAAETVPMTLGNGGTDLGTISSVTQVSDTGLNAMGRIVNGHNRWSTSAVRQYLNSTGANWFSSQEDFDIRPDQYNKKGFMSGFSSDFLAAVKPVKVTTALNTVEGFADAAEDTFDTFFLPSLEQINATPQLPGAEGDYFEYWRSRLGLSDFAGTGGANVYDAYKIPAINTNTPMYVRLRSAYRLNVSSEWIIQASGRVSDGSANAISDTYRFAPVCVVC